ncbi:beta-lactamase [Salinisphaera orenii MK-B5]|uniref:Beta-lactamase n=2 Tax=Salinisphaera TaxID=180541 RepID=A0A423PQ49_9GAMM|nr:beta-lactamase [Salinisphaera orenii MK-B5]
MNDGAGAMRFALLGSGSKGNALVVEYAGTRVLIDCGFSAREIVRRLARLDLVPADIDAVVITHEHDDHWRGVSRFSRAHGVPVWLTPGTLAARRASELAAIELYSPHEPFAIGDIELFPYPVPHDAREPAQLVVGNGDKRLGVLADIGHATPHVREMIDGCDGLVLECNHDPQLLAAGPYPAYLKARVAGRLGHLSNAQAAELLAGIDASALQQLVVAHISESNNRPELAQAALAGALSCTADWVHVANQSEGLSWRTLVNR